MITSREFWNRRSQVYDDQVGGVYAQAYDKTVSRSLNYLRPEDQVLEFACGTGIVTLRLAPHVGRLWAIDISDEMAARVTNTDLFDASLPQGTFDAVLAYNVLCYVEDLQGLLSRVRSLLKPGGVFLSATDCLGDGITREGLRKFWKSHTGSMPYVAFFSIKKLEREITRAGFAVLERENLHTAPPNLFVAARRKD